jgi:hypothetical protein
MSATRTLADVQVRSASVLATWHRQSLTGKTSAPISRSRSRQD